MKLQTCNANCSNTSVETPIRPTRARVARLVGGVALVVAIVNAELWGIRQEPVLVISSPPAANASTKHASDATAVSFPLAILH